MSQSNRVYLFDTTLRDGAQTQGVDFTVADKAAIARELDRLGVDYIEGGWPGPIRPTTGSSPIRRNSRTPSSWRSA